MSRPTNNVNKIELNQSQYSLKDVRINEGWDYNPPTNHQGDIFVLQNKVGEYNGWQYSITDGIWCECWKYFDVTNVSCPSGNVDNSIWWGDAGLTSNDRKYPFEFVEYPCVSLGFDTNGGSYDFWIMTGFKVPRPSGETTFTHLAPIILARASSATIPSATIYVYVKGKIKEIV